MSQDRGHEQLEVFDSLLIEKLDARDRRAPGAVGRLGTAFYIP